VAYAIAAGNSALLKVSEFTPRALSSIATVFKEAGLLDGVLNVISCRTQDAPEVTRALFEHKAIKKINFTGSTAVGRILAELAGKNLKPILLELGGKAPAIVFETGCSSLCPWRLYAFGSNLHVNRAYLGPEVRQQRV
jgi:acyl-CoA reductase-like NAD-dependent aldehyde dehydrogenase